MNASIGGVPKEGKQFQFSTRIQLIFRAHFQFAFDNWKRIEWILDYFLHNLPRTRPISRFIKRTLLDCSASKYSFCWKWYRYCVIQSPNHVNDIDHKCSQRFWFDRVHWTRIEIVWNVANYMRTYVIANRMLCVTQRAYEKISPLNNSQLQFQIQAWNEQAMSCSHYFHAENCLVDFVSCHYSWTDKMSDFIMWVVARRQQSFNHIVNEAMSTRWD